MGPVFIELFVHEGAVAIIREMFADRIERILKEFGVVFFACCKIEIDQICRSMVTNRVPVLLRLVNPE